MAYEFVATAAFEKDYDDALAYLIYKLKAPHAALRLMETMEASITRITDNPPINAVSTNPVLHGRDYRVELVLHYVMIYQLDDDRVIALRLFHETQDYANLLLAD